MKAIKFIFSLIITLALTIALNSKFGSVPPLGKFLDPVHGFWANAESGIGMPGSLSLPGIQATVDILYDDMLVPHIFSENEDDLFIAAGYVHAYHRLWQMEFQTHAAAGRLSEIVGELTLEMDRMQRRKGMTFGARNFVEHLDENSKNILRLYSIGVNAYIDQLSYETYPLEYKLLDYQPEAWTVFKSGLLYKFMADMLNAGEKDLQNTNFKSIYGKEMLDLIYPDVDNYQDPVVEKPNHWKFEPMVKDTSGISLDEVVTLKTIDGPHPYNGSNNWAIGPSKSASGNALLCNDMHLSLYMPSLWFYYQVHCGDINVFGHSLPGIPGVITGFTDSVAWGFTNAQRDLVDWYKIKFENDKRDRYFLDGAYVDAEKKIEKILVRNQEPYYDTVVYTVFGPVTYDRTFGANDERNGYARRWLDHDPSDALKMFYSINKAKSFEDYMEALNYFSSPAQNVVFASATGDIAHRVQGKYPLNNYEEGKFLKDGTRSSNNWTMFIPNEHNAFWKNPERGFVSSANQHPADSTYPYYITARSYESYRNRRINDVLRSDDDITIEDLKHLHFDNYSMKASESLPTMLRYLYGADLSAKEKDIIMQLGKWDYTFDAASKLAVYYDIWFDKLFRITWDEIKISNDNNVSLIYPTTYATIKLMKSQPDHLFFDIQGTSEKETAKDLVLASFREMLEEVNKVNDEEELSWGSYKGTYIGHQLRIKALGSYDLPAGGNGGDVVNATDKNHGPSQRLIVEMDPKGVKAWGHYPGGQSGNPGSRYYDNMVEAWTTGSYYELLFLQEPDTSNSRIIFSQKITGAK
jgi:penicillin amidase